MVARIVKPVFARLTQFRLELGYVVRAVEALICCVYHLPRGEQPWLVLVDRNSIRSCLSILGALRVVGRLDVRVLPAFPAVERLVGELENDRSGRRIVLSRLLYAKYYMRFQTLRARGALTVA